MKVKEESEKSWLKTQHSENEDHAIWSHHFMGNRWGNSGNFIFGGSKITVDNDCGHDIKRRLHQEAWVLLVAQLVKNLPGKWEAWV